MRILVSPLDWGLGHASRSAVVVKHLLKHNNEVILAGSGDSLRLLQEQFPDLPTIPLKSYSPWTSDSLPLALTVSLQLPYFFYRIVREHFSLQRIIKKHKIDLVISDNRYGLCSSLCHTAIITHQLSPIPWTNCPEWVRNIVSWGISRLVSNFDYCLIPDFQDHRLSGNLSVTEHIISSRTFFIGPLSRYAEYYNSAIPQDLPVLGILTGPKKSRLLYEKEVLALPDFSIRSLNAPLTLIGGRNNKNYSAGEIAALIQRAQTIHSRSGYTTIMDLYLLNALSRAHLTPTPGQAEQEYLASLHHTNSHISK